MARQEIAVIADPHFHDVTYRPGGGGGTAFRSLANTVESTRVFNESFQALPALLDDIVRRGIEIVIVVGDLSDDGQRSTMTRACALLERYNSAHGLRFFATPGNHDLYAMHGRHQSKFFLDGDGTQTLVTSDPAVAAACAGDCILTDEIYCGGYPQSLGLMASFGFFKRPEFLHWECPFGQDDSLSARQFEIRSQDGSVVTPMTDASYLVEPVEGLWVLSIDANVFEPRNGATDLTAEKSYFDSTDAGWNSMLRNKRFILDWMADVARRAREQNKRLLAFSHYPMLDTLNGTAPAEAELLTKTGFSRRTPSAGVARAAAATAIGVHFSGHLHLNDTAVAKVGDDIIVNIAVPSTVSFPPAYKIVSFEDASLNVETVLVDTVPGFDATFDAYAGEVAHDGRAFGDVLAARDHMDFLDKVLRQTVLSRYVPREWPKDMAALVPKLHESDLVRLAGEAPVPAAEFRQASGNKRNGDLSFLDIVVDWYRLRHGRSLAFHLIGAKRLQKYRDLADLFAAAAWPEGSAQSWLMTFFSVMTAYMDAQPSDRFSVDLTRGEITGALPGRTVLRQTGTA
ncbi:metallophosphoesterase [Mesorhizobium sp. BE184]|uniref:metallophosphoesterase family protein n=1 Tax=Mesorhizobium sp. BE184 TaxID=2817714 RepID=UPI002860222F|nr:metallophosphoesterase [Mesorhizobium sp. BE184]MDR7033732.1 3',5'-cyclic AMP phosphodiesterase CpdA [Mesorhizobium sp. BE184]